ncbi:MAG: anthranilate phosphoribosyltransferase [Candidatus Omnitrophica bacterium]|nr:anthranilate phosphoribosyltransferase [Candidatus Omnitrophota bacterium]
MIKEAIAKIVKKENLSFKEALVVFEEIFDGMASSIQVAAFLAALSAKGETEDEIAAAAQLVREKAIKIKARGNFLGIEEASEQILDTCGTGGSGVNKFNISTAVAFIVAAAGVKVAKHGNRAMSSNCGSADVLEAMGVKIEAHPSVMEAAIKSVGVGFLYAPLYHPALKAVAQIRKELGIRTIFNILGPLSNPALATHQLLGVYKKDLVGVLAKVLRKLSLRRAFVVNSEDLKDEISLSAKTTVAFLNNKKIEHFSLTPGSFGLKRIRIKNIEVRNAGESAQMIEAVLNGAKGAPRDIVCANASACFFILGKVHTLKEGVRLSGQLLDEGKAKNKFLAFKEFVAQNA